MDATLSGETTAQASKQTTKEYKSPPHALIWFFRKSRDLWKSKYQELQASIKRLKNRVADVTKSREQWKLKAEQTNNQLTVLEAENASLRTQIATLAEKKTRVAKVAGEPLTAYNGRRNTSEEAPHAQTTTFTTTTATGPLSDPHPDSPRLP